MTRNFIFFLDFFIYVFIYALRLLINRFHFFYFFPQKRFSLFSRLLCQPFWCFSYIISLFCEKKKYCHEKVSKRIFLRLSKIFRHLLHLRYCRDVFKKWFFFVFVVRFCARREKERAHKSFLPVWVLLSRKSNPYRECIFSEKDARGLEKSLKEIEKVYFAVRCRWNFF